MQNYSEGRKFLNNLVTTVGEVRSNDVHVEFCRPQDRLVSTRIQHIAASAFLVQTTEYPIFPHFTLGGDRIRQEI